MKTILNFSVFAFMLVAATSQCFALVRYADISVERAKELGVTIRSHKNGDSGIMVRLEFKPQGVLKNFTRVDLEINAADKQLVDAPLQPSHPSPESVEVYFSADPAYLATSVLTIMVHDGERTNIGYRLKVKDFIEPEKSALALTIETPIVPAAGQQAVIPPLAAGRYQVAVKAWSENTAAFVLDSTTGQCWFRDTNPQVKEWTDMGSPAIKVNK